MQFTPSHQSNAFAPVLQRILEASGQLFKRRIAEDAVPLGVESALPGLEVMESTWDVWAGALHEAGAPSLSTELFSD